MNGEPSVFRPGAVSYYVEHIDESLGRVPAHGGEVTVAPYREGDLWVALFRDPAGNIIGVWAARTAIVINWLRSVFTDSRRPEPATRTMAT